MYITFNKIEPIVEDILSTPTSSFREHLVIEKILNYLKKFSLNIQMTKYKNIIAKWGMKRNKSALYFISHMDHPGFLVIENNQDKTILKVMGGVPFYAKNFKEIAEIDISTGAKYIHKVRKVIKNKNGVFTEIKPSKKIDGRNIFTLNLRNYYRKDNTIYARAIDDLGGCAAQMCAIYYLSKHRQKLDANVHFVFTRAEEVGFIGLISLIKNKELPKEGFYISCETSKCISSVQFGKGVVLRLGDKAGIFESRFTNSLLSYFQTKISLEKYPIQKALLDGGTCEATPLVINNYKVSGLACPLGNYHNFSTEDKLIKEEFIDINDFISYINTIIEISLNFSKIIGSYNKSLMEDRINKNYCLMKPYLK